MLRRIAGSVSFRSGPLIRRLVERLPPTTCPPKPVAPFRLLTLSGRSQLPLLRESLLSIARTWERYPKVVVATDGTTPAAEMAARLDWWPGPLVVEDGARFVAAVGAAGHDDVVRFAHRSPMGIKLAALLVSAKEEATFVSDTDVLWFGDFSTELSELAGRPDTPLLRMSTDYQPAYQREVVDALWADTWDAPFGNAGVAFLSGDLLKAVDLRPGLAVAAERGDFFAEQTLLACASRRLGAEYFRRDTIACFATDAMSLGITFRGQPWRARHFVGPVRHLFWRDALALRLGIRP